VATLALGRGWLTLSGQRGPGGSGVHGDYHHALASKPLPCLEQLGANSMPVASGDLQKAQGLHRNAKSEGRPSRERPCWGLRCPERCSFGTRICLPGQHARLGTAMRHVSGRTNRFLRSAVAGKQPNRGSSANRLGPTVSPLRLNKPQQPMEEIIAD